jgi:hypothetical protein
MKRAAANVAEHSNLYRPQDSIALAALFLISVRNAFGSRTASEGHRLGEAMCKPCHAIEPHIAELLNQAKVGVLTNQKNEPAKNLDVGQRVLRSWA